MTSCAVVVSERYLKGSCRRATIHRTGEAKLKDMLGQCVALLLLLETVAEILVIIIIISSSIITATVTIAITISAIALVAIIGIALWAILW